jgi:predicted ATPase
VREARIAGSPVHVDTSALTLFRGWCDGEEGRLAEGLAAMRDAFAEYVTTGQRISTTAYSRPLAQAHLASGHLAGANQPALVSCVSVS